MLEDNFLSVPFHIQNRFLQSQPVFFLQLAVVS